MNFTFGKQYRLCSKKKIEEVFQKGNKIHGFPFLSSHLIQAEENPSFKVLLSVPKKFIKKAHDRNYIKRCMREGIRKNKALLEELLILKGISVDIAMVYICKERKVAEEIENKIIDNIKKIKNALQKLPA